MQNYIFLYMQCMPSGNSSIVRKVHLNWRDFAFFVKTDWSDLKLNQQTVTRRYLMATGSAVSLLLLDHRLHFLLRMRMRVNVLLSVVSQLLFPSISEKHEWFFSCALVCPESNKSFFIWNHLVNVSIIFAYLPGFLYSRVL